MCAQPNLYQPTDESSVIGKSYGSMYRVLRAAVSRDIPRSVHRDHAGRNATSVKGLSPDKQSNFCGGRASMWTRRQHRNTQWVSGTTGVRDHGMYGRLIQELGRTARNGRNPLNIRQGIMAKSDVTFPVVVRRLNCSEEVG